jgi:hypothetical protein
MAAAWLSDAFTARLSVFARFPPSRLGLRGGPRDSNRVAKLAWVSVLPRPFVPCSCPRKCLLAGKKLAGRRHRRSFGHDRGLVCPRLPCASGTPRGATGVRLAAGRQAFRARPCPIRAPEKARLAGKKLAEAPNRPSLLGTDERCCAPNALACVWELRGGRRGWTRDDGARRRCRTVPLLRPSILSFAGKTCDSGSFLLGQKSPFLPYGEPRARFDRGPLAKRQPR